MMKNKKAILILLIIGIFAVYVDSFILKTSNSTSPYILQKTSVVGMPEFINVTYLGQTLNNISDQTKDIDLYKNVTLWYKVEGGGENNSYLEIFGDDGGFKLNWDAGDGPYASFVNNDGIFSYYSFELNVTKDTLQFIAFGDSFEGVPPHTIKTTNPIQSKPIFVNVTRDNDSRILNVDDFGFDIDQNTNVSFYYVVGNGTISDNFMELLGSVPPLDWSTPTYFKYIGNNGSMNWSLYKLTLNITSVALIEYTGRHSGDWINFAEEIPGDLYHQLLVTNATFHHSLVVDQSGKILDNSSFFDAVTGETVESTVVTVVEPPLLVYLVANITNIQPTQFFGVGYTYISDVGNIITNWTINAVFNLNFTNLFNSNTEYWAVPLLINRTGSLEFKSLMQIQGNATIYYEAGVGPANHKLDFKILSEDPLTEVSTVVTIEVSTEVTTDITTVVSTEVTTIVSTGVTTVVSTESYSKSAISSITTEQTGLTSGFEILTSLLTTMILGVVLIFKRKND